MTSQSLLDFACSAVLLGMCALAALLASSTSRTRASSFLTAFFVCLGLDSVVGLIVTGWPVSPAAVRWLHVVNIPTAYLYGPLLYGYVLALTTEHVDRRATRALLHLLPGAAALVFSLANAIAALDAAPLGSALFKLSYHAWVLSGLFYLALAVQRIEAARPRLEERHADDAALRLTWLRRLAALIAVIWIAMAADRLPYVTGVPQSPWLGALLDALTTVALYVLAWFGLRQRVLATAGDVSYPPVAYARSGLAAEQCAAIAAELSRLMTDEALYADSAFDLDALSRRSGWPPNYVSQALNQGLGRNFFEFVNGFRVAAAERHLADPAERRTILDIALACGFGSKSTFNAVFKRMTGRTPSEWRRAQDALSARSAA